METGTYLTEIGCERENMSSHPLKKKLRPVTQHSRNLSQHARNLPLPLPHHSKLSNCRPVNSKPGQCLPEEYYALKRVKPGICFYRAILQAHSQSASHKVPQLRINLPETLVLADNSLQLLYSDDQKMRIRPDISHTDFVKLITKGSELHGAKSPFPASLLATSNGTHLDLSIFMSSELDSRIYPKNENQVAIRYVSPFNGTPNMLRLFYTPQRVKGAKPNLGFKITNLTPLSSELFSRKLNMVHNYVVDPERAERGRIPMKGKALEELEAMSESIIGLLEHQCRVRITELVIDYTFGADRRYYFQEIKSVKSFNLKEGELGQPEQIASQAKEKNSQIYCRLCCFLYTKAEMTHIVTNKLIIELLAHLRSRGQDFQIENSNTMALVSTSQLSNTSSVCALCYSLIIAEHQLIDLEHQFCQILNMASDPINRVPSMITSKK